MKNEITIPLLKDEDFVSANKRRDTYALTRDLQALEFNGAIITRLQAEKKNIVKCETCGKEFSAGITSDNYLKCSDCK
jgi:hypothetical protein